MRDYRKSDPELARIVERFAYTEVAKDVEHQLKGNDRHLAILSALMGCGGVDLFALELERAIDDGFDPVAARELVYQGNDYLGMGRTLPFLEELDRVLEEKGITLPLPDQGTVGEEDRLEKGAQAQGEIFGPQMLEAWKTGTVNRHLAANCFGDYYTRNGLDLRERELVTFCLLLAQGGCEPQLVAHSKGNMNMGNDASYLESVTLNVLPYVGYPRSLNALAAVRKASCGQ